MKERFIWISKMRKDEALNYQEVKPRSTRSSLSFYLFPSGVSGIFPLILESPIVFKRLPGHILMFILIFLLIYGDVIINIKIYMVLDINTGGNVNSSCLWVVES